MDGASSYYAIPVNRSSGHEITDSPEFTKWILRALMAGDGTGNGLTREKVGTYPDLSESVAVGRLLGVEQSNTSIRFGDEVLVKLNRKLSPGLSPEVELATVIAKSPNQDFAPSTYAMLTLENVLNDPICLAVASEFVPNVGDAWAVILDQLGGSVASRRSALDDVRKIGTATGKMHLALLGDPWRKDVSPEPIRSEHISQWEFAALEALESLSQSLEARDPSADPKAADLVPLLQSSLPILRDQISGFQGLSGSYRMRVHGDYHLGQVMKAIDGRFVIVDFDGEPNRPLAERRQKFSALKDVAGMLRSLAYARGTIEQRSAAELSADLRTWEFDARSAYLDSYLILVREAPVPIVPTASDDIRRALAAIELEKAIYECGYELSNRPDWLWLPLSRLVTAR